MLRRESTGFFLSPACSNCEEGLLMRCAVMVLVFSVGMGLAGCGQSGPSQGGFADGYASAPTSSASSGRRSEAPSAVVTATEEAARTAPAEVPEPRAVADAVGKAEVRLELTVRPPRAPEIGSRRFRTSETPASLDPRIQSGTLTAGSFDDVLRFDDYRRFVAMAVSHDPRESLPRLPIERRAMIEVFTAQGMPVGGARVTVHAAAGRSRDRSLQR